MTEDNDEIQKPIDSDKPSYAAVQTTSPSKVEIQVNNDTDDIQQKRIKNSILIVFFSMFLDMMGISVVAPILPYFAEAFGANSFEIGALLTTYAATSAIATLLMGKFSDNFGRRPMILFSLFGTCIGFLMHGFAQNYVQLLIYRCLSGLFGMSRPIAQAFITDVITDKSKRNKYIALTGATIGMSFVIGPIIGTVMSYLLGLRSAYFTSSVLGAIGFIFAYFYLIESHPKYTTLVLKHSTIKLTQENTETENKDKPIPNVVWILSFAYFIEQLGWSAYESMYVLFTMHVYQFTVVENGIVTVVYALSYIMTAGYFYHKICKAIGQYNTCLLGCILFSITMFISVCTDYLWITLIFMFLCVGFGESLVASGMPAIASNYTNEYNRGYVMGVINGAPGIARVIGPLVHGALFSINVRLPYFVASGCGVISFVCLFVLFRIKNNSE